MKSPIQNFFLFLWTLAFLIIQGCVPAANSLNNQSVVKGECLFRGKSGEVAKLPVNPDLANDIKYTSSGPWIGCETVYTKRSTNIFRLKDGQTCADAAGTSDYFNAGQTLKVKRTNISYETSKDGTNTKVPSCESISMTQVTFPSSVTSNTGTSFTVGCAATEDLTCNPPASGISPTSLTTNMGTSGVSSIFTGYTPPVKKDQCKGFNNATQTCKPGYTLRQVSNSPRGVFSSPLSMIGRSVGGDHPAPCLEDGEPPVGFMESIAPVLGTIGIASTFLTFLAGSKHLKNVKYTWGGAVSAALTTSVIAVGWEVIAASVAQGKLKSIQAGACVCASDQVKEVFIYRPLLTAQNMISQGKTTQSYRDIQDVSMNGKKCYVSAEDLQTPVSN